MAIDLMKFCASASDHRDYLRSPWKHGAWVYATDGRRAVRVHAAAYPEVPERTKPGAMAVGLFEKHVEGATGNFQPLPPLPALQKCPECSGHGKVFAVKCEDCDGEGCFTRGYHSYTCKTCEDERGAGPGWIETGDEAKGGEDRECYECDGHGFAKHAPIQLGQAHYNPALLHAFMGLPQVRCLPGGPAEMKDAAPMAFIFDGGQGLLMPMRK